MSVYGYFWWGHWSARVPAVLQHRSSEGRILAASRPAKTSRTSSAFAPRRVSFGRITEHLEVPNLLAIQNESFDWLVGNEAWQGRSADDPHARSGLAEILEEISPIEDFSGTMSLSFSAPRFDEVKASIEECKEKDLTYCAPLFVTAEFTNNTTGEIKSQTVFMGDFPMMTPKGTFIINGTERVVVSQLVRSPGVYFSKEPDKTSDRDLSSVKVIPSRGAWLEFDIDKRDTVGVRIDRKRRQAVTVLLKAIGWSAERIREQFGWSELMMTTLEKDHIAGADEALLDIYRKLRPGEPPTRENAQTLLDNLFFNPKRYDVAKVGRYKFNKKLEVDVPITTGTLTEDDVVATVEYLCRLHAGEDGYEADDIDHFGNRRLRTVGELIQNQVRVGLVPHGAGRPRADDHPGRRGDHAADPDQHPPGGGGDQGVLRHVAAVAVHGPDQPAVGPDPPAPPVGARPGRSVPRARRLRGPRRALVPLRPDVPDRDAGRPEHRPDRRAVDLRPGQPVRLHRDAVPQGRRTARSPTRSTT